MARLRIALAQINPTVGAIDANLAKIAAAYDEADAAGCDIVAFPELAITGYPPEDLVLKPGLRRRQQARAVEDRCAHTDAVPRWWASSTPTAICTTPPRCAPTARWWARIASGCSRTTPCSTRLATSRPATERPVRAVRDRRGEGGHQHLRGRVEPHRSAGAPGCRWRRAEHQHQRLAVPRRQGARPRAHAGHACCRCQLCAGVRQPGVRAGRAGVRRRVDGVRRRWQPDRPCRAVRRRADDRRRRDRAGVPQAPARPARPGDHSDRSRTVFVSEQPVVHDAPAPVRMAEHLSPDAELYQALVLGTGDYVRKNGFTDVVIGLSRWHRLHDRRLRGGRRAGRRPRARREHAQPLQQRSLEERRGRPGREAGHRLPHHRHRAGVLGLPADDRGDVRRSGRPTSPRRTCRAASAAPR